VGVTCGKDNRRLTSPGGAPSTNAETVAKGEDIAEKFDGEIPQSLAMGRSSQVEIEVGAGEGTRDKLHYLLTPRIVAEDGCGWIPHGEQSIQSKVEGVESQRVVR
jgi:hypothetical protein